MYLLVVKYIYYRHKSQTPDMENPEAIIKDYCKYIYANDETQRIRTQVTFSQKLWFTKKCEIYMNETTQTKNQTRNSI